MLLVIVLIRERFKLNQKEKSVKCLSIQIKAIIIHALKPIIVIIICSFIYCSADSAQPPKYLKFHMNKKIINFFIFVLHFIIE